VEKSLQALHTSFHTTKWLLSKQCSINFQHKVYQFLRAGHYGTSHDAKW